MKNSLYYKFFIVMLQRVFVDIGILEFYENLHMPTCVCKCEIDKSVLFGFYAAPSIKKRTIVIVTQHGKFRVN